ncbi:phage tail protein [Amycolatopsis samaneae]|uniref:Phage tail protein n=1 Tax=Amycolatopsis samaneae TaxID=664691 RepID=A0ABW5GFG3_9PSEU
MTEVLVAFRFVVRVDDLVLGGFTECGGLQLETEVQDYPEGGQNTYVHKLPGRVKQTNIRLKRGLAGRALWEWYARVVDGELVRRNGSVQLTDGTGAVETEWQFSRAYPVKWQGPDLNATQNQVAAETIELAYEGLRKR